MGNRSQRSLTAAVVFCVFALGAAVLAGPPEGRWEGEIQVPDRGIEILVDLVRSDGQWLGDLEIPSQFAAAVPFDQVQVTGIAVILGTSKIPGNPLFEGALSDDGRTIKGNFSQGGNSIPFLLTWNPDVEPHVEQPDPFRYTIDPEHTTVAFKVRHFTVSNVLGRFNTVSGTIHYDPEDLSKSQVEVTIDAGSIDTDHEQRDAHLKSADFLKVDEFPKISFKSRSVRRTEDGYLAAGDLTIRGTTRTVEIPFTLVGPIKDPLGLMRMGVEGELTIDRREFGLVWNRPMETGGVFVGHEVRIELIAEATRL